MVTFVRTVAIAAGVGLMLAISVVNTPSVAGVMPPPTNLTAQPDPWSVVLTWDYDDMGAEEFRLYRWTSSAEAKSLIWSGREQRATDTDVVYGDTYYYEVVAVGPLGVTSEPSNKAAAKLPRSEPHATRSPRNLEVSPTHSPMPPRPAAIPRLEWDAPTEPIVDHYDIWLWRTDGRPEQRIASVPAGTTKFRDDEHPVSGCDRAIYHVAAVDAVGNLYWSGPATITYSDPGCAWG